MKEDDDASLPIRSGWAVELAGHNLDLLEWERHLRAPHVPSVHRIGAKLVLRTPTLDESKTSEDAYNIAAPIIKRLNGAMAIWVNSDPVVCQGIIEIDSQGRIKNHYRLATGSARLRVRASAISAYNSAPSEIQHWNSMAESNSLISDALVYLSGKSSWIEIFKALECIETICGGRRNLKDLNWIPKGKLDLLALTADALHRHRVGGKQPPKDPMPIEEALNLMAILMQNVCRKGNSVGR